MKNGLTGQILFILLLLVQDGGDLIQINENGCKASDLDT